jgi:hypothetical protein
MSIITELNKKYEQAKQMEEELDIVYKLKRKQINDDLESSRGVSIFIDCSKHKFIDDIPKNNRWASLSWNAKCKHFVIDTDSGRIGLSSNDFELLIEAYHRFIQE